MFAHNKSSKKQAANSEIPHLLANPQIQGSDLVTQHPSYFDSRTRLSRQSHFISLYWRRSS